MLPFRIRFEDYDTVLFYPEGFETHHFKEAIPARNRYRVDHTAYALCFVEHSWGGAAANTWREGGNHSFRAVRSHRSRLFVCPKGGRLWK